MKIIMMKIQGKFMNLVEDTCPARWRSRHCKNPPTQYVVFLCDDDVVLGQMNTCLSRYCKQCYETYCKQYHKTLRTQAEWVALSDEDTENLLREAEVLQIQEA